MAFRVEFAEQSIRDLDDIFDYVDHSADEVTAGAYVSRIRKACLALTSFSNRGTPHDELKPGLRSVAFERRATIFFEVEGSIVRILQILHGGRDPERVFTAD